MEPTTRRRRRRSNGATIHDVARAAGVSIATVSRVLANNYPVAAATRQRVLDAVDELEYTTNAYARALSGAAPGPVSVLLGDITGPSFAALAQGVEREARARGRLCLVGTTDHHPERELALLELMRQQQASAVILPGGAIGDHEHESEVARYARLLEAAGSRVVLCGRPALAERDSAAVAIGYDNEGGAAMVAREVLHAGHRRVLVLPGVQGHSTARERLTGFRAAFREAGIDDRDVTVRYAPFDRAAARAAALDALDALEAEPFTAILCGTDDMAAGVLEGLRSRGLRCPQDISVTGFDDVPGARDLNPALTTVRVPYEEMGALAVTLALDGTDGAPARLPTTVVRRDSVAPPASPAVHPG